MQKVLAFVLLIPLILLKGFTISSLWSWFVCPIGVTPIGIVQAVGLSLLAKVLIGVNKKGQTQGVQDVQDVQDAIARVSRDMLRSVATSILLCASALGLGWVAHSLTW